jgi:hypothetical protein
MKVYVAGPMRGIPSFNFPAFHAAASRLRGLGHEVFNPAEHDEDNGFQPADLTGNEDLAALGFSLREALATDLSWIALNADAVAVLPDWQRSMGAKAEVALARALSLEVLLVYP